MSVSRDEYQALLTQFQRDISFSNQDCGPYVAVEKAALDYFRAQGFSPEFIFRGYEAIKASCAIATMTYPFVPVEVQEVIAIYTSFAILIDDTINVCTDDLRTFLDRLCGGQSEPNPLLRGMLGFLADVLPRFYGPFASNMIRKATIEFIRACVLENEYEGKIELATTTPDFPYYLRHKTGIAEGYALFAFPEALFPESIFLPAYLPVLPDLALYFNLANDLLSFYKESVAGPETFNYILNQAKTKQFSPNESLRETIESLTRCVADMKTTLASPEHSGLQDAVTKLVNGYVIYHCSSTRYRLSELNIRDLEDVRASTDVPYGLGAYIKGESLSKEIDHSPMPDPFVFWRS